MHKGTAILAMLLAFSCRKAPGPPDPNYDQGAKLYQQLYVSKLDDAYGDPQMDTVAGLLQKVDRNSVDASAADALLDTIKRGRDAYAKARAEREKLLGPAQQPPAAPNIDPTKVLGLDRPVDAGAPPDPFGPGASISEINAASGGCLVAGEAFHENVTDRTGTIYRLSNVAACTQRLPGFAGQMVLVSDGRIYRRLAEEARPAAGDAGTPAADGGTAAPPDAGTAGARPGGTTSATAPTDAGPESYIYVPGSPLPPGMSFPDAGLPDAGGY